MCIHLSFKTDDIHVYGKCYHHSDAMPGRKESLDYGILTHKGPEMKTVQFANTPESDEVAPNESPHLDLHCVPFSL